MEHVLLDIPRGIVLLVGAFSAYVVGLYLYRLSPLHPLAKFPGPKLAAVTSWYEAYYEIALNGQYSKKISQLHDKYGMSALHVSLRPVTSVPLRWFDRRRG